MLFCCVNVKFPLTYILATLSLLMSTMQLIPSFLLTLLNSADKHLSRRMSLSMTSEPPRRQPTRRSRSRRRTAHIHRCRSLWLDNKGRGRDRLHHPHQQNKPFYHPSRKQKTYKTDTITVLRGDRHIITSLAIKR